TQSENEEMPLQPRKVAAKPPPAAKPATPPAAEKEKEEEEEEEEFAIQDEGEEEEADSSRPPREATRQIASTGPHSATRGRRRKQRSDIASLVLAGVNTRQHEAGDVAALL